jgi:effector-binding domain-containing protein
MLDKPQIVHASPQMAAVIRFTIPRSEIQAVMGPGFGELMSTLAAQGIAPAGPFFSHHFKMDPATFDFELGVPVTTPVKPTGRVKMGELPGGKVVRTVYTGPYEGLGDGWGEFMQLVKKEGHDITEDLWECYLAGPESGADSSKYRTELNRPLAR